MSSRSRQAGIYLQQSVGGHSVDPWCLTCGVNLRLDGRTFSVLSREQNGELCDIFSRVLGAEFCEEYASINVCNRCERQLRRLGRYNSIILARQEGQRLREQLEKNLAKHGQTVVESARDQEQSASAQASATVTSSSSRALHSSFRKGSSHEGYQSSQKRELYSSRSSSVSSVHSDHSAGGERGKSSVSFLDEAEQRRENRRRKFSSNFSSSSEDSISGGNIEASANRKHSLDSRNPVLSSLQHRSAAFREAYLPKQATSEDAEDTIFGVTPTAGSKRRNLFHRNMATSEDKRSLVARSESLDAGKSKKKSKKQLKDSKSLDNKNAEEKAEDNSASPWAGRINPFNVDPKTQVLGDFGYKEHTNDEVFSEGIVDLDQDDSNKGNRPVQTEKDPSRPENTSDTNAENNPDSNAENRFTRSSSDDGDLGRRSSQGGRSSLSDMEEQINIKTQFKGFYYNIGSTEDLLKEFADEKDAEKATMQPSDEKAAQGDGDKPKGEIDTETTPDPESSAKQQKGKLLKFESLDLDIDTSNPFYEEVFDEFHRRIETRTSRLSSGENSSVQASDKNLPAGFTSLDAIPESVSSDTSYQSALSLDGSANSLNQEDRGSASPTRIRSATHDGAVTVKESRDDGQEGS